MKNKIKKYAQEIMLIELSEDKKGFSSDIEKDTIENSNFRKVLYTGENTQLVLMSLLPNEDIGEEIHEDTDQFFRIEKGSGTVIINDNEYEVKDGSAIIVPASAKHNVIASITGLKLYTLYSPPHHKDCTIHVTKKEASSDDEKFDGNTTE
jgi:mannose-6-phosphate isomerase-like protein (cupin superfamily)